MKNSRDPPFYAGTSLNLTCKVDLPNTVDPQIISRVQVTRKYDLYFQRQGKNHYFIPLDMNDDGTYVCIVCLFKSDYNRDECHRCNPYPRCHYGNEFNISGIQTIGIS